MPPLPPSPPAWVLTWHDDFEAPDGSPPSPRRWVYDLGDHGFGNHEWQSYTDRTRNIRQEAGCLVVEAHHDGAGYTSARIKTQGLFQQTYGRLEARIRLPAGQGMWPAFWALGDDIASVDWPDCGEIDVMENIGREPDQIHGTLHGPGYCGAQGISGAYRLPSGQFFYQDFHVYSSEWNDREIAFQVDGQTYHRVRRQDLPSGAPWVFDHPFFLILNLAVGGDWPGPPDASTVFPQRMLVDWVRVYRRR